MKLNLALEATSWRSCRPYDQHRSLQSLARARLNLLLVACGRGCASEVLNFIGRMLFSIGKSAQYT